MRRAALLIALAALFLVAARPPAATAQFVADRYTLTEEERSELNAARDHLRRSIDDVKAKGRAAGGDRTADVEIYLDGVGRCLRQGLFFAKRDAEGARALLNEGEARAVQLAAGETPWERKSGDAVLGYRSEVDGSVQPYHMLIPEGYERESAKPGRLDIFLHGRGGNLSELNFIRGTGWPASAFGTDRVPYLALFPYGRGNNGWRFAGERDMFEALADVRRRFKVDPDRITLRGFSMGGHGCWHIGLQHPGDWAVISPGAGFTDTLVYQKITAPLPNWQRALLHLYDPVDYAANAVDVPTLAYCGEDDPALGQHRQMVEALRREGAPFQEFIGPMTPHRYEPKAREAILAEMAKHQRRPEAGEVRFVTYTLRFPECKWVRIEGLERHWDRAEVHAVPTAPGAFKVTTRSIASLSLAPPLVRTSHVPPEVFGGPKGCHLEIDGQTIAVKSPNVGTGKPIRLVKTNGSWQVGELKGTRKKPGLQGPIDDALFGAVLAVSGSGAAWSEPAGRWTVQELQRFRDGWDEFFRARLPEKTDQTVTDRDLREKSLYLFGDPGSNAVLRRILPRLPLKWTRDSLTFAGKTFSTRDHLPVLVFPNPENPERYVVLNSGFTFSREDWNGSNARQYPHLPDYAVLHIDPDHFTDTRGKDVVLAGFFDEHWQLPK